MCVLGSPDVFVPGDNDEGQAEVVESVHPLSRLQDLRRTAAGCPESAITVSSP
jgi:ferredoxin